LFGDEGGGARTAGRIENKVARVGDHEETTLDDFFRSLDNVSLFRCEAGNARISPNVVFLERSEVLKIANVV
jgi:hypothetical protein